MDSQPRKLSSNSSASALSHVDIRQHTHNLSVPSLAATLSVSPSFNPHVHSFIPQTPRRIDFATGYQPAGIRRESPVSQSATSKSTSSPSSAERERIQRLQQRRKLGKRRDFVQSQSHHQEDEPVQRTSHGHLYTQISTPPPRRSSKRTSKFVGFDGIFDPTMMTKVNQNVEQGSEPPLESLRQEQDHSTGTFYHATSGDNVSSLSSPPAIDRHGDRRCLVEEAREQAQQIRDSARNSVRNSQRHTRQLDPSFMRPEYATPHKDYHDDGDDLTLGAAPPPSMSSNSLERSRLNETLIPPNIRSHSRLDQIVQLQPKKHNRHATQLYIISYLIFFSILGTLARLGLEAINFYPGTPVNVPVLWANFAGCLILGFILEDRNLFMEGWGHNNEHSTPSSSLEKAHEEHVKVKKTIPLYIGLAIGFCGSLTSFSTFMEDAFLAISNDLPIPQSHPYPSGFQVPKSSMIISRNAGYSICALLGVIIITMAVSLSATKAGAHLAIFMSPYVPTIPFNFTRKYIDKAIVPIAWLSWLGALIMAIVPPDRPGGPAGKSSWDEENWRPTILSCLFAPLGCLLRYQLAIKMNGIAGSFPLGTFTANIFGTAVLGMAFDLNHVSMGLGSNAGVGGGLIGCQVLSGVSDGFCGSLTTVSTFCTEIIALGKRAYLYATVTIATALAFMIVIMGSVRWSIGWQDPVCS